MTQSVYGGLGRLKVDFMRASLGPDKERLRRQRSGRPRMRSEKAMGMPQD